MKSRVLLVASLAAASLAASRPDSGEVRPYFGENYEGAQIIARGYDQVYHEGIRITGTVAYIARVREALDLIEEKDPRNWYFVRKHVRRITLSGHPGMDIGGGRLTTASEEGVPAAVTAGGIVHEAWHRELFFSGAPWEGREAERFCLRKQNEALVLLGALPLDPDEALAGEYWKVDYWSRDW
jgi:hypothetical protein